MRVALPISFFLTFLEAVEKYCIIIKQLKMDGASTIIINKITSFSMINAM